MSAQIFYCIVSYLNTTPFYYSGYYGVNSGESVLKPAITLNFNDALKLHSKEEAERILPHLKLTDAKVEEHAYM